MESFESQWAVALKKTKLTSKIPLNTKQENVLDQIKYNKARLKDALKSKNKNLSWAIYKKLVQSRARLFALKLQQAKNNGIIITEGMAEKELRAYIKDCKRLARAINSSLKR
ncbi:hypothetical protein HY932_02470 [Candidatus Falkowbacteria bacterium]|nr:hypothetical protein [Candidatus Falkowbacteria bacterium]